MELLVLNGALVLGPAVMVYAHTRAGPSRVWVFFGGLALFIGAIALVVWYFSRTFGHLD